MYRTLNASKHLISYCEPFPLNYQTVRWARKPIWLPTAKSKLFRIPKRVVLPEDEKQELKRLYNNYRTTMKSVTQFLTNKYSEALLASADTEQIQKAFQEDFARCTAINNEWNDKLRVLREERIAASLEAEIKFVKNRKIEMDLREAAKIAKAEEVIKREKELVKTFITEDKLDEVIEKAIANPVDYNFAIDLQGNKIIGRETKPQGV